MTSVIIPVYNRLNFIENIKKSFTPDTHYEFIIIDDASTFSIRDHLHELNDYWVRYFRLNNNKGPSYARNYGFNQSKGDYVLFLDSDDVISEQFFVEAEQYITKGYDLITCDYYTFDGKPSFWRIPEHPITIEEYLIGRYAIAPGSACIKRELFKKTNGFIPGLKVANDWTVYAELILHSNSYAHITKPYFGFQNVKDSVSVGAKFGLKENQRSVLYSRWVVMKKIDRNREMSENIRHFFSNYFFSHFKHYHSKDWFYPAILALIYYTRMIPRIKFKLFFSLLSLILSLSWCNPTLSNSTIGIIKKFRCY